MDIEKLKNQLIIDEGIKYQIYTDTKGYATFGIGHKLTSSDPEYYYYKNLKSGEVINVSQQRVDQAFENDVAIALKACQQCFPDFDFFLEEVQQIIANMMFNIGQPVFSEFHKFIEAITCKNYKTAAQEMVDSSWYSQVGNRAKRLYNRMLILAN